MGNQSSNKIISESTIRSKINSRDISRIINEYSSKTSAQGTASNKFSLIGNNINVNGLNVNQQAKTYINTQTLIDNVNTTSMVKQIQDSIKRDLENYVNSSKKGLSILTSSLSSTVDELNVAIDSTVETQINNITLIEIFYKAAAENYAIISGSGLKLKNINIKQIATVELITDQIISNVSTAMANTNIVKKLNEKTSKKTVTREDLDPAPIAAAFGLGIGAIIMIIIAIIGIVVLIYFGPTIMSAMSMTGSTSGSFSTFDNLFDYR